ncbi:MAG: hypothetical protein ACREMZ_12880 [Gemmatimonadales bacterium]
MLSAEAIRALAFDVGFAGLDPTSTLIAVAFDGATPEDCRRQLRLFAKHYTEFALKRLRAEARTARRALYEEFDR